MRWTKSEDKAEIEIPRLCQLNDFLLSPTEPNTVLGLLPFPLILAHHRACPASMHWLGILYLLVLLMADLVCPSCGKIIKNQHGLSLHTACWCEKKYTNFTEMLQEHQDRAAARAEEEQRRLRLEAEEQAERERLEREQDAVRVQRIAAFESLAVSLLYVDTKLIT